MLNQPGQTEFITSRLTTFARTARQLLAVAITASLLFAGLVSQARAQSASNGLDPTFGGDGIVTTRFFNHPNTQLDSQDRASDLVIQPDGKIVVAGTTRRGIIELTSDFAVARYDEDGRLDKTFDSDGKQKIDFGTQGSSASAVALQTDGKIIVAGSQSALRQPPYYFTYDFALARLNSNGRLDPTFGTGGKVVTDFAGGIDFASDVAIQPDGKIVLVGYANPDYQGHTSLALARYNSDGSLDQTFGAGGKVTKELDDFVSVQSVVIQSDGKILVGVASFVIRVAPPYHTDFYLARYNSDGSPDTTFGPDGLLTTEFYISGLALQPDGKIVGAGSLGKSFAVARYNSDGSPDTTFNGDGKQTTNFSQDTQVEDVIILPGGKIVVAGHLPFSVVTIPSEGPRAGDDFALARYNSDGSPDRTFDHDGKLVTDLFSCSYDSLAAAAAQGDGKIVVVGGVSGIRFHQVDFAVARYPLDATSSAPRLMSLKLNLPRVYNYNGSQIVAPVTGGDSVIGTVRLCSRAPSNVVITITDSLASANAPASVTIPAGKLEATFTIKTALVTALELGAVTASLGAVTKSVQMGVRPIGVASLTLRADYAQGGRSTTGTVELERPAPAGGIVVMLSSSDPRTAYPEMAQLIIPPGVTHKRFTIRTNFVPSTRPAIIKATVNGISKSAVLMVGS
ncbi:MAG: delta-60 repeat domain-containing protein [Pyrinomonadaceae bacterium]